MPGPIRLLIALIAVSTLSACVSNAPAPDNDMASAYDADLAERLGADEYGMRSYVMVILNTGPAKIEDGDRRSEIFAGHFANMSRLAEAGTLVLAGPFIDGGEKRGLYIFNVATIEEAKELVQTDPAVAVGIFTPEFTKYYGSAALMQIGDIHKKVQKKKIG